MEMYVLIAFFRMATYGLVVILIINYFVSVILKLINLKKTNNKIFQNIFFQLFQSQNQF